MTARELAFVALREWRGGKRFADSILQSALGESNLEERDRAFATELFYGVLRNLMLLDFWIDTLRSGSIDSDSRDILRLGLYQIFLLETPAHAAVFETVRLASRRGRAFVNAILRTALRRKDELNKRASEQPLAVRASHPVFLIERWNTNFGKANTSALCEWNNWPAPIYARANLLKISAAEFFTQHPESEPVSVHPGFASFQSVPMESLGRGECYVQDPSTMAACELLDPQPGETVLDACAAPGGKTSYLAELMKNRGVIIACDRDPLRTATLQENLNRLGVKNTRVARRNWGQEIAARDVAGISLFDRILVDAPCSNTGVMRRRPDLRWRLSPSDLDRMQKTQLAIVRALIPLLKRSGVLVYSTCSIEPEENERVVELILREFPLLELAEKKSVLPFRDEFDGAFAAKLVAGQ